MRFDRWLDGYSKRAALIEDENGVQFVRSYNTVVAAILPNNGRHHGEVVRLWNDYSKTTVKHVSLAAGRVFGKAEWLALPWGGDDKDLRAMADEAGNWFDENIGECILVDAGWGGTWYEGFKKA